MKALVAALILAAASAPALAATAYHTGLSRQVTTVSGGNGVSCQYQYAGKYFWVTFNAYTCPMNIEV